MILLVGDLHFDPDPSPRDRERQAVATHADDEALAHCLATFEGQVTAVVLLGDVFDAYIEYPHAIPRPPVRLFGLLARWHAVGVPIHYVVGNHDPWHRQWVERDLGWNLHRTALTLDTGAVRLHASHGDREEKSARGAGGLLTRIVRSHTALRLYTRFLPGDWGMGLARRVSRAARSNEIVGRTVNALRSAAAARLEPGACDIVAFGHCHVPALERIGTGWYVNPGLWPVHRLVGVIDQRQAKLVHWTGGECEPFVPEVAGG